MCLIYEFDSVSHISWTDPQIAFILFSWKFFLVFHTHILKLCLWATLWPLYLSIGLYKIYCLNDKETWFISNVRIKFLQWKPADGSHKLYHSYRSFKPRSAFKHRRSSVSADHTQVFHPVLYLSKSLTFIKNICHRPCSSRVLQRTLFLNIFIVGKPDVNKRLS
jgi:hypothetical protein